MKLLNRLLAPFTLILLSVLFFWKVIFQNLIPFPGDMLAGAYYPWLDYKWGYPVGVPIKNALISDVFSQFFIWKSMIIDSISKLQWPLWNIFSYSGYPLLANFHSGSLNPFNLLMLIFGDLNGWSAIVVCQVLLSSITMFLLLTHLKHSKISAITGALVYSYSSFMTTWSQFVTAGFSLIYIPLLILTIDKYLNDKKNIYLLPIPLLFFLLITSGHLQSIIYTTITAFLYFLYKTRSRFTVKQVVPLLITTIISLGIVSIQILPTIELSGNSIRYSENYIESSNYGLLPISNIFTLISPDFFGNPATHNFFGFFNYHETVIYLGLIFPLAFIWCLRNFFYLKNIRFFIIGYIICFLMIFDNPISRLLYIFKIPFLYTSAAGRLSFLLTFFGAIIVSEFVNNIGKPNLKTLRKITLTIFILIISQITLLTLLKIFYAPISIYIPDWYRNLNVSLRNLYVPALLTFMFSSATIFLSFFKKNIILKTFFLIITVADLFRFGWKYTPFVDKKFVYPKTEVIEFLQQQKDVFRVDRESGPLLTPNTWSSYGLMSPSGYDPMAIKNYVLQYDRTLNGNVNSNTPSRYSQLSNYDATKLGQFNVKYLLALKYNEEDMIYNDGNHFSYKIDTKDWKKVYEYGSVAVLENNRYLPRSFLLSSSNTLIVKNTNIITYTPNLVQITYSSPEDAQLILLDSWYPGWSATVNNNSVSIEKYNEIFRSVNVPRGEGKVIFTYKPKSFYNGFMLTVLSLFAYLIFSARTIYCQIKLHEKTT